MKVFKFGGASVKDAAGIKNVSEIIRMHEDDKKTLVVVSATGKTTNALEKVVEAYYNNTGEVFEEINKVKEKHLQICRDLFENPHSPIFEKLEKIFADLHTIVSKDVPDNYNYVYDQIVPFGEITSSVILSEYLNHFGVKNEWLDVRDVLKTDDTFREAVIHWEITTQKTEEILKPMLNRNVVVTQGFIGATFENITTTLGREGSDYTGAIFANILNAESQTIWKDVPGVMNGDPRKFQDAIFIDELTYLEAVEMTYYGASVIHPKTIKPIQNKDIPLYVKSFINPHGKGTKVYAATQDIKYPPVRVLKENQALLTFHTKDFSFVPDDTAGELLKAFANANLKINMIQTGAISLQTVVDNIPEKIRKVTDAVRDNFKIQQEDGLTILTIRHYNEEVIRKHLENKKPVLTQKRPSTFQILF